MSKVYKTTAMVLSAAIAFFFSWFLNNLTYTYFPSHIAGWIQDGVSTIMIMLMLCAVGFFDKFHCEK